MLRERKEKYNGVTVLNESLLSRRFITVAVLNDLPF